MARSPVYAVGQLQQLARTVPLRDVFTVARLMRTRGRASNELRRLRLKPLGTQCWVRAGTSDIFVLRDTFIGQYHLPPPEAGEPTTILDLGSNIGLTVAHYAVLYPAATILGIELDPEAAELAQRNVALWRDRCSIVSGAVSTQTGIGSFERTTGEEWGFRLSVAPNASSTSVPTYSVGDLVARLGGTVDFLKVDIEGGEAEILADNTGWTEAVKSLSVEIHPPAELDWCEERLTGFGFSVRRSDRHRATLIGVRRVGSGSRLQTAAISGPRH